MEKKFRLLLVAVFLASGLANTPTVHAAAGVFAALANERGSLHLTLDSSGNVYVTNFVSSTVSKVNSSGTIIWSVSIVGRPRAIIADELGNIFVTIWDTGKIAKISTDGNTVDSNFATTGGSSSAIVRDSSGNFYTANQTLNTVTKFSPTGGAAIASYALGAGQTPYSLTIDSAGNLYTANYGNGSVSKITSTGTVTEIYRVLNSRPWGITADSSGNVYVTNNGQNTVTKILSDGTFYPTFANISNGSGPVDIALDPAGNIYTANTSTNNVSKIAQSNLSATSGGSVTSIGTVGSGINGMAIDSTGNIYTSSYQESTSNAVYKIDNVSSSAFSLSASSETVTLGSPITGYNVNTSALAISRFSISPAIGNGLSFSTSTGRITGTPLAAASAVTYTITGNSRSVWVSQTYAITVNAAPVAQTITFPDLSPVTLGGAAPALSATASSSLTIAYTSATTSICTVSGTTITTLTTGTCTINANQPGNASFLAATQVQKSFLISPAPVVDDGAAVAAAAAAAAKRAAEQQELINILALIPKIGELTISLGETTKSLYSTKCVRGKSTKFVKRGTKCPKGFVKR